VPGDPFLRDRAPRCASLLDSTIRPEMTLDVVAGRHSYSSAPREIEKRRLQSRFRHLVPHNEP
jgi:hypothetical protein